VIRALGHALSRFAHRWVPDPFAIALLLTLCTLLFAVLGSGDGPLEMIGYWGGRLKGDELLAKESGFWKLLTFAMQMCLILVTGHALASSKPVSRFRAKRSGSPYRSSTYTNHDSDKTSCVGLTRFGVRMTVGSPEPKTSHTTNSGSSLPAVRSTHATRPDEAATWPRAATV